MASGTTTLNGGVIESTAAAALNQLSTGTLVANDIANHADASAKTMGYQANVMNPEGATGGGTGSFATAIGTGMAANAGGLLGAATRKDASSVTQSAIGSNVQIAAGSTSGDLSRSPAASSHPLTNSFDAQQMQNDLQIQQVGSQVVGQVGGMVSDTLHSKGVAGFDEDGVENSYGRIALETAGNGVVAAVTGGSVGAAAAGTAAAGITVSGSLNSVASWVLDQTDNNVETAVPLVTAIENIIASGAGAAGGVAGGGGKIASINALNGASQASAVEQYNAGAGDILKIVIAIAKSRATKVTKDALFNTLERADSVVAKGLEKEAGSNKDLEAAAGDAEKEITRPTPRQSEKDVANDIGENAREQVSYKNGKEVHYGTKGSSRIDVLDTATGESYEVKNCNIENNSSGLISNIVKQVIQRASQLPKGMQQNVVIDVRGQNVSMEKSMEIVKKIVEKSNGIISHDNITFKGTLK